uniref:Putative secreted protein n=1 Tax=Ixodes ricinus TaxID=34613 RepID=A0A147BCK7_IXORI
MGSVGSALFAVVFGLPSLRRAGEVLEGHAHGVLGAEDEPARGVHHAAVLEAGHLGGCVGMLVVELPALLHLPLVQSRNHLVDNVLQSLVHPKAAERPGLVDGYVADGAQLAGVQIAHDAHLAEGVEAVDQSGGVHQVAPAQHAGQRGVQVTQQGAGHSPGTLPYCSSSAVTFRRVPELPCRRCPGESCPP